MTGNDQIKGMRRFKKVAMKPDMKFQSYETTIKACSFINAK
jgi:hypothetical protein